MSYKDDTSNFLVFISEPFLIGLIPIFTLKISIASGCRFRLWIVTDLSVASHLHEKVWQEFQNRGNFQGVSDKKCPNESSLPQQNLSESDSAGLSQHNFQCVIGQKGCSKTKNFNIQEYSLGGGRQYSIKKWQRVTKNPQFLLWVSGLEL